MLSRPRTRMSAAPQQNLQESLLLTLLCCSIEKQPKNYFGDKGLCPKFIAAAQPPWVKLNPIPDPWTPCNGMYIFRLPISGPWGLRNLAKFWKISTSLIFRICICKVSSPDSQIANTNLNFMFHFFVSVKIEFQFSVLWKFPEIKIDRLGFVLSIWLTMNAVRYTVIGE